MENNNQANESISAEDNDKLKQKRKTMVFDTTDFAKLVINDLSRSTDRRSVLKKYKQSEVKEIIEGYRLEKNQIKLREISQLLYAKSPQYQRLIHHFSKMPLYAHVITPIKDLKKISNNKITKQYTEVGEELKAMRLKHEAQKILDVAFREDVFYGYVHRDKNSFYLQQIDGNMCRISSVEEGAFNYSIDMSVFQSDETKLQYMALEVQAKYFEWKKNKKNNPSLDPWVELDARNTICIKVNETIMEVFPPFAGSFDAIFDIEGYKRLRKDKDELGNYMLITQEVPIRQNSEHNNDFAIDDKMFRYFHNMASKTVPENVGVITSPMKIEPIKFDRDRVDSDGVAKAERDFWSGSGTSQLLFNADKSTSQGLLMSIKTDEEMVFSVLTQIETWINRYLRSKFKDLMFHVNMLHVTHFNKGEEFDYFMTAGNGGIPVKSHICAIAGLEPIEVMNMAYLENDILKLHEQFIPLMSSHTMGSEGVAGIGKDQGDGAPKKKPSEITDEGSKSRDKSN